MNGYVSIEYVMQRKCDRQAEAQNIVEALWAESDLAKGILRLCTAYCQQASLEGVCSWAIKRESGLAGLFPYHRGTGQSPSPSHFFGMFP